MTIFLRNTSTQTQMQQLRFHLLRLHKRIQTMNVEACIQAVTVVIAGSVVVQARP